MVSPASTARGVPDAEPGRPRVPRHRGGPDAHRLRKSVDSGRSGSGAQEVFAHLGPGVSAEIETVSAEGVEVAQGSPDIPSPRARGLGRTPATSARGVQRRWLCGYGSPWRPPRTRPSGPPARLRRRISTRGGAWSYRRRKEPPRAPRQPPQKHWRGRPAKGTRILGAEAIASDQDGPELVAPTGSRPGAGHRATAASAIGSGGPRRRVRFPPGRRRRAQGTNPARPKGSSTFRLRPNASPPLWRVRIASGKPVRRGGTRGPRNGAAEPRVAESSEAHDGPRLSNQEKRDG